MAEGTRTATSAASHVVIVLLDTLAARAATHLFDGLIGILSPDKYLSKQHLELAGWVAWGEHLDAHLRQHVDSLIN